MPKWDKFYLWPQNIQVLVSSFHEFFFMTRNLKDHANKIYILAG